MIKLFVLSRDMVEGIRDFASNALVISIGSPGGEPAKLKGENIFKFQFHDITEELFIEDKNMIMRPMEKEIAESIAEIVEIAMSHRDKKVWVIHCEAGISRSPGVAIGLAKFIDTEPDQVRLEKMFPYHNKHVRKLVEKAMRDKIKEIDEELSRRMIEEEK